MLLELHMIQNFAPSNLNRDDTNAPKSCEFGGVRRARISSQAIKRAIRTRFKSEGLEEENLAVRTRLLVSKRLVPELASRGRPVEEAQAVVESALLNGLGLSTEEGKTQYLLFLAEEEIRRLANLCEEHWDVLLAASGRGTEQESARERKRRAGAGLEERVKRELQAAFQQALDGARAADLALFGRMVADRPDLSVDAACQVAHAVSTHAVSLEFDFYTAVDDLQPKEESGAGMMGTVEFDSACFYRYANVDTAQLVANLKGDSGVARRTVEAFLRASVHAVPSGKQNSMAAHNPPSLVLVRVRKTAWPWNLANAFVPPVRPDGRESLVKSSTQKLFEYLARLEQAYGREDLVYEGFLSLEDDVAYGYEKGRAATLDALVKAAVASAFPEAN